MAGPARGPTIRVAGRKAMYTSRTMGWGTFLMDGDLRTELVGTLVGADVEHPGSGGRGPA
jgi:hypothetical protein